MDGGAERNDPARGVPMRQQGVHPLRRPTSRGFRARGIVSRGWVPVYLILLALSLGTSIEAQSVDVGSFAKSTNTSVPATQVVSHSLGETPKLVILWTSNTTGTSAEGFWGFGASDGSAEYAVSAFLDNGVSPTANSRRIATKVITQVDVSESTLFEADLTSWNTTTFTLSWSTNNASAVSIHYIAIGGSGISADVMNWTSPTGTGNHSETGVGFQPDVVITAGLGGHTVAPSSASVGAGFLLGVMDATGDQWAMSHFATDNQSSSVNARAQRTNRCLLLVDNSPSIVTEATFVSMDSDGFTMNFSSNFGVAIQLFSICISGVNVEAGSFNKITSGSSQSVTTTLRQPELLLLSSWQRAASTSAQTQTSFAFGASDGTDEAVAGIFDEASQNPTDSDRFRDSGKVFAILDDDSQSFSAAADLTSFDWSGFTLNWSTNDATATEICYLALVPFASVAVRLTDFEAEFVPQKGVQLTWRSESELDNLGFHVERMSAGGARVRVTPRLIPGSALTTTPGTVSSTHRTYRFSDPSGLPGDRYWLIDQDLGGATRDHGPIIAAGPSSPSPNRTNPPGAVTTSASLSGPPPATAPTLRHAPRPASVPLDRRRSLAAREGLSLEIEKEGWVFVAYDEWTTAGLAPLPLSRNLELTLEGVPVAFSLFDGGDGTFGPGDVVEFYGLPLDDPNTRCAPYWLTVAPADQKPIRIGQSIGFGSGVPPASFQHSVTIRDREQFFAGLRNGDADNFFGPLLSNTPHSESLSIPHLASASLIDSELIVRLQGIGDVEHSVEVVLNGISLGDCSLHGTEWSETLFPIPPALLDRQLELELTTSGPGDFVFLHSVTLEYPRTFTFTGSHLRGEAPGGTPLVFAPVPSGVRLYDVTDPQHPLELATAEQALPTSAEVAVRVDLPPGSLRTWLAVAPGGARPPLEVTRLRPTGILDDLRETDLWIVAPRDWLDALEPLAKQRRREGLSVQSFAIEDLISVFRGGVLGNPTRDALQYVREVRGKLPGAVFLIGDATYDPQLFLAGSRPTVIPTALVESARLETASDLFFGDLDEDGDAEVPIGRLPAESVQEVISYVDRAIRRTVSPRTTPFEVLLVSDDDDRFSFRAVANDAAQVLPPQTAITWVDRNTMTVPAAQRRLAMALRSGPDLVAYFGHGGTANWAAEDLITTSTISSLGSPQCAPIVLSTSCLTGYFHHRLDETLGESWLAAPEGALAIVASTAMTNPRFQSALGVAILEVLSGDPTVRIGEALRRAQFAVDPHTVRTTVLLGDPTLPLRR